MTEGLKIVNELNRLSGPTAGIAYPGLLQAILLLTKPENKGLWERLKRYIDE